MKGYLFGSIFYEKDIMYNAMLANEIRKAWPGIDLYVPQEAVINDKKTFADSRMIYEADYERLKNTDLLIGDLSGDLPPIGSVCELGIFSELAKNNPDKRAIILHTDTRDASKTFSEEKVNDMKNRIVSSQFNYFNLFVRGVAESCGTIVGTHEQLVEYVHSLYTQYRKTHHFSGIYKITNRINGKFYIGLAKDVLDRLNEHRFVSTKNPQAIDLAIRLYGIENFTFEILEKCSEEDLSEREIYWSDIIYKEQCYAPLGYNIAKTGYNGTKCGIEVSSYNLDGSLNKTYPSFSAAAKDYAITDHAIVQSIERDNLCCNMMWREGHELQIAPYVKHPNPKGIAIDVYLKNGDFFKRYDNETAAAKELELEVGNISNFRDSDMSLRGYYFVTAGEKFDLISCSYRSQKIIYCYDKDTHLYVKSYPTVKDAEQDFDGDLTAIPRVCKGKGYYSKGYIWSYLKYDRIPDNYREINKEYWEKICVKH